MKWKCTTSQLLSVPVAMAAIGIGASMSVAQDRGGALDSAASSNSTAMTDATQGTSPKIAAPTDLTVGEGRGWRLLGEDAGLDITCGENKTQNLQPKTIVFPNVPVCNGAETVETWIARTWAAGDIESICQVKFGIGEIQGAQAPTSVDVVVSQGAAPGQDPLTMPMLCTATAAIPGGGGANGQFFTVDFDPNCDPDPNLPITIALRIAAPVGSGTFIFPAGNNLGETNPTYIASAGCGINTYVPMSQIGFPEAMVLMQVGDKGGGEPMPGACCLPKENGEDPDPACVEVFASECADLGGSFNPNTTCDAVTCPTQVECPDEDDCPAQCPGDINGDGNVDGLDLLALLGCWGSVTPGCECSDLNNDGNIDGLDLLILLGNWGACPPLDGGGNGVVFQENEPCGERHNDGCNQDPPAFTDISCGDTVCGTAWTAVEPGELPEGHLPGSCQGSCGGISPDGCYCDDLCFGFGDCCIDICEWCSPPEVPECVGGDVNTRDTDWYRIVVEKKVRVTWNVHAEFPAQAIIAWRSPDCGDIFILDSASSPAKVPFSVDACLQPGIEYILFVSPSVFEGLPCDGEAQWGDAYTASVVCTDDTCEKGACCFGLDCVDDYDEFLCFLDGGEYAGDGTVCADNPCPSGACCLKDGCVDVDAEECINQLDGAFRGEGTTCADMVPIDLGCNGQEELVPICRECDGGTVWCNLQDECDNTIAQDPYNGGCNYYPDEDPEWEQLCCGDLVGGDIWAIEGEGRDLDWRVLTIKKEMVVSLTLHHSFPMDGIIFLAQTGCPASIISSMAGGSGVTLTAILDPGKYYVIVTSAFAAGTNNECGPGGAPGANTGYQLEVGCGNANANVCAGDCGNPFAFHPGFPGDICSCDADFCSPNGPEYCCPGVCDHCTGALCDAAECQYDPNSTNNAFTWTARGTVAWAQGYTSTCPDNGIVNNIASSFGSAAFPGTSGLSGGEEVRYAILAADPGDGGPGAVLWYNVDEGLPATVNASAIESDQPQLLPVPGGFDVSGLGTFYVMVWVWVDPACATCFVAPADNTAYNPAQHDGLIWLLGGSGDANIDIFNPNAPVNRLNILDHVWMLRVNDS